MVSAGLAIVEDATGSPGFLNSATAGLNQY